MKTFFGDASTASYETPINTDLPSAGVAMKDTPLPGMEPARVAVYDALTAPPRIEEVFGDNPRALIEALSSRTYQLSHEAGGDVPYVVIREVVENLIHAHFYEVVVSILDGGTTIRFSDQGPGISDKDRAFQPGFSTATEGMKRVIKGVGSGLPVARECLTFSGGGISIEDNLERGTVVTLRSAPKVESSIGVVGGYPVEKVVFPSLSNRQKQVLSLAMELGVVGPTIISRELGVGLSTAYRDLASLEDEGLITSDETGKRTLTSDGVHCLDALFNG